jgi:hypothetical protein
MAPNRDRLEMIALSHHLMRKREKRKAKGFFHSFTFTFIFNLRGLIHFQSYIPFNNSEICFHFVTKEPRKLGERPRNSLKVRS